MTLNTRRLCTYAVSGKVPVYQAIYTLQASDVDNGSKKLLSCLCQACAEQCHGQAVVEGDDAKNSDQLSLDASDDVVQFVGWGPSYCDCRTTGCCQLEEASEKFLHYQRLLCKNDEHTAEHEYLTAIQHQETTKFPPRNSLSSMMLSSWDLLPLQSDSPDGVLVVEALSSQIHSLIQQSKDTFWLPIGQEGNCLLEQFAAMVRDHHIGRLKQKHKSDTQSPAVVGAEWWVQVKDQQQKISFSKDDDEHLGDRKSYAIDLHYDKDEELATCFGLGSFPVLSTVTYLTDSPQASTLVYPRTYHCEDEAPIDGLWISRARTGKHLCFDGRLLHGVPAGAKFSSRQAASPCDQTYRITFLVNLWYHRPIGVSELPDKIRVELNASTDEKNYVARECDKKTISEALWALSHNEKDVSWKLSMPPESPVIVPAESTRTRVPFLGTAVTWGGDEGDDNDDSSLADEANVYVNTALPTRDVLDACFDNLWLSFEAPAFLESYDPCE